MGNEKPLISLQTEQGENDTNGMTQTGYVETLDRSIAAVKSKYGPRRKKSGHGMNHRFHKNAKLSL
jgi:hypothetical protein